MYGTIARLQIKPGALEALREMSETAERPEGAVADYVYQMDDNPQEVFLVVMFKDKESYQANAQRPEQHQKFLQLREHLTAEPEWHDGEIVYAFPA